MRLTKAELDLGATHSMQDDGELARIPTRKDQPRQLDFDKAAYRDRNRVERLIGRLMQYRRIAARYEKRATNDLAIITLGMTMLWLT